MATNISTATTFATGGGKVTTDFGGLDDTGYSLTLQADGKIIVAGASRSATSRDFALARYNVDGSLDESFSSDGKVTTDISGGNDSGNAVAVQVDGKIVVAGFSQKYFVGGHELFAVARYNVDGSLDTGFDGDGKLTTDVGGFFYDVQSAFGIAIQTDSKILVAGFVGNLSGTTSFFALVRYNPDGSLDTSFDGDGMVRTSNLGVGRDNSFGFDVTVQADGKIIVAGASYAGDVPGSRNSDFGLARYNNDGSLDTSFSGDGKLTIDFQRSGEIDLDNANSVIVQPDGKILAVGYANWTYPADFALVRYNSDGSLDVSFDGDGKVTTDVSGFDNWDGGRAVALQTDGKILVAGWSMASSTATSNFAVVRYNTDGSLDQSFSNDGIVTTDIGGSYDDGLSITVQSDGKILVAGQSQIGGHFDFALVRYNTDGSLDALPADLTGPTVTITDNLHGTANRATSSLTYSLAFSEAVTGLDASDFTLTNGTISSVTGSGNAWSVNATPVMGVASGTIGLTLKAGAVSDAAGNLNAVAVNSSQALDTLAPTATFTPADEATGVAIDSNITVAFSEAIAKGTGNISLKTAAGQEIATFDAATSANLSVSGSTLTIDPSADLGYSTGYVVEFAAGSIKDLAGNSYAGTTAYNFSSEAQAIAGEAVNGGAAADNLAGTPGNDTVNGGAGTDTFTFTGARSQYLLTNTGQGYQAQDTSPGRDGTDTIAAVEMLVFSDCTVDLTMAQKSAAISASDLKTLEELYVGFFNRIPEAAGLGYWIGELGSGVSLESIADQFYGAGVQFGLYPEGMSNASFVREIYENVLGRPPGVPPTDDEVKYWVDKLVSGEESKGTMVLQMLSDVHTFFEGITDPTHPNYPYLFVADHLNNKASVANYFAVQQGLSYTDAQTNIARGIEVAAAITPTDTLAAIALIGVNEFSM